MKVLLTTTSILILAASPLNPLLAAQQGMAQERGTEAAAGMEAKEEQLKMMDEESERSMEQQREMTRDKMKSEGQQTKSMEEQQERRMEQEHKEQGVGTEKGEPKKERKWWRFWE